MEITGRVTTNDGATIEEIRDVLTITYAGASLDATVEQASPNLFSYVATIPDRGNEPGTARIALKSGGGFAGAGGEAEVTIDPAGSFKVTGASPAPDGNGIVASFSAPVDPRQDLTGLLRFRPEIPFTTSVDGNRIHLYPSGTEVREAVLVFDPKLSSTDGQALGSPAEWEVSLGHPEPGLRTVGNGTIMPHEGQRLYTFEAVGLDSVYLEVFRIEAGNVLQFLQEEALSGTSQEWSLRRVGTIVGRRRIPLNALAGSASPDRWTRYAIDLDDYVEQDEAAIYQIRLGFGLEDTDQACSTSLGDLGLLTLSEQLGERNDFNPGFGATASLLTDYSGIYGYGDWESRDDPCSPAYYNRERFLLQNVMSSNLGLIAKRNPDRSTQVVTTNLLNSGPQGGVSVTAYSYDRRELFSGTTDAEGMLSMTTEEEPAFLFATLKQEAAYLRLDAGEALPLGRFDVGGTEAGSGLRGAFFAERGVWRPGDSVFLHFVLEDKAAILPAEYPVTFTLQDARGRVVERRIVTPAFGSGLYSLSLATDADDPTGTWIASVEAGGKNLHPWPADRNRETQPTGDRPGPLRPAGRPDAGSKLAVRLPRPAECGQPSTCCREYGRLISATSRTSSFRILPGHLPRRPRDRSLMAAWTAPDRPVWRSRVWGMRFRGRWSCGSRPRSSSRAETSASTTRGCPLIPIPSMRGCGCPRMSGVVTGYPPEAVRPSRWLPSILRAGELRAGACR